MENSISSSHEPLRVLPISPGIALGPVRLLDRPDETSETQHADIHIQAEQLASESQRLQQILSAVEVEMDDLHARVARSVGQAEAEIFTAQKLMLRDPDLLDEVHALMTTQLFSAEAAWQAAIEHQSALL